MAYQPNYYPHMAAQPSQHFGHSQPRRRPTYVFPCGKLIVTVIKAEGIRGDEWCNIGKADPYAVVRIGGRNLAKEGRTSTHMNAGSRPVWNHLLSFLIKSPDEEYNEFKVSIYNKNGHLRRDNSLGEVHIRNMAEHVISRPRNIVPEEWYPVVLKGGERGRIKLGFHFIPLSTHALLESEDAVMGSGYPSYEELMQGQVALQTALSAAQVLLAIPPLVMPLFL